jgi:hypothetical protein
LPGDDELPLLLLLLLLLGFSSDQSTRLPT